MSSDILDVFSEWYWRSEILIDWVDYTLRFCYQENTVSIEWSHGGFEYKKSYRIENTQTGTEFVRIPDPTMDRNVQIFEDFHLKKG